MFSSLIHYCSLSIHCPFIVYSFFSLRTPLPPPPPSPPRAHTHRYTLDISVADDADYFSDQGSLTIGTTTVHIDVTDINDVPVICVAGPSAPKECGTRTVGSLEIYEDASPANGDSTIPLFGSDFVVDLDGDDIVYSLAGSAAPGSDNPFVIDSTTGKVTVAPGMALDYESTYIRMPYMNWRKCTPVYDPVFGNLIVCLFSTMVSHPLYLFLVPLSLFLLQANRSTA